MYVYQYTDQDIRKQEVGNALLSCVSASEVDTDILLVILSTLKWNKIKYWKSVIKLIHISYGKKLTSERACADINNQHLLLLPKFFRTYLRSVPAHLSLSIFTFSKALA